MRSCEVVTGDRATRGGAGSDKFGAGSSVHANSGLELKLGEMAGRFDNVCVAVA